MSTLAALLLDPACWSDRDAVARAVADELGVDPTVAGLVAAALADNEAARARCVEELWQVRERMANAQSLAAMGDFDWHIASDSNAWSDELFRLYGYLPGEIDPCYALFFDHVHPDDRDQVRAAYQRCYDSGEPYSQVERIVRRDGETRYLWTNAEVILDERGTPSRLRGTSIDVTEQVLAEHAREAAATRLGEAAQRRHHASEIHDNVVQGLTAAVYALELDDHHRVGSYLRQTLEAASQMMTDLLEQEPDSTTAGLALVRSAPAALDSDAPLRDVVG